MENLDGAGCALTILLVADPRLTSRHVQDAQTALRFCAQTNPYINTQAPLTILVRVQR